MLGRLDGPDSGSPWWRAVNERLLRDTTEATLLVIALFEGAGFVAIDLGGLVTGGVMQQLHGPLAGVNLIQL